MCEDCLEEHYTECADCGEYHPNDCVYAVYNESGDAQHVCEDCLSEYEECPHCGERVKICDDGTCPCCGAVIEAEDDDETGKEHEVA